MKKLKSDKKLFENKLFISLFLIAFVLMTLVTNYYGTTDTGDYLDSAKFFAGKYSADVRNTHSYIYGWMNAPFVWLFENFISFKIVNLICIILISFSLYTITKRKESFYLSIFSPIFWYLAPWASPIPVASLFFLWSFYFVKKFEENEKLKDLFLSGILIGVSWLFWDTMFFFGSILAVTFLFNKKSYYWIIMLGGIVIGLFPRMLFDYYYFNFPVYSILKTLMAAFVSVFGGGIYSGSSAGNLVFYGVISILFTLLIIPIEFYKEIKLRKNILEKKIFIFIILSFFLILSNIQPRYFFVLFPFLIIYISRRPEAMKIKKQIFVYLVLILIVFLPYAIQIEYYTPDKPEGFEIVEFVQGLKNSPLVRGSFSERVTSDLQEIYSKYPAETYLVGNSPDDYQTLAHFYWGKEIKEFVSVQDYNLYINNQTRLYEKTIEPVPKIPDRRQIFIMGGLKKNENDPTDFEDIKYAISFSGKFDLEAFEQLDRKNILYLSIKKSNNL